MSRCHFCETQKPLTVENAERTARICSECVWKCAEKLVEHGQRNRPPLPSVPAPIVTPA